ncbi:hypothetical protein K432DRAFT_364152 [Lepidopterella palustris CBS 459.81]|uniref:Uncharacterized protein n=1 Tax=Lepidopterella palustris CBS 459.81 TaxID=1314670 RepID=A0A8E2DYL8_9PEZI|nr:hypothetical protein K432DRAFT_364152 [Lepidopterella palustris CBS 459.81]
MGGLAFSTPGSDGSPPLKVPRLSSNVYVKLKSEVASILELFYNTVAVPHEAPGKIDHGDIDFLVEGPRYQFNPDDIAKQLKAKRHVKNGPTRSFAIPHPQEEDSFVQVDIHVCSDGHLIWDFFMNSYSDLWHIISVAHRSLGITANDKGLHVRIAGLEERNRKASMIFLTDDPTRTMQFLGLDYAKYNEGFNNEDELFDWVTRGQFFHRELLNERTDKSNDRRRMNTRGMYKRFLEEWMSSNPTAGMGGRKWTRDEVLQEALDAFEKRKQYQETKREYDIQQEEDAFWKRVAETFHLETSQGLILKALKIWVRFDNGRPVMRTEPQLGNEGRAIWTLEMQSNATANSEPGEAEARVLEWIQEHWVDANALEKKRQNAQKRSKARDDLGSKEEAFGLEEEG